MKQLTCWILTVGITLPLLGCGGDPNVPELGYVEGTVKLDGKPLANVVLTFQPDKARPSYGKTNDEGWYELTYTDEYSGATIGTHTVRISSADSDAGDEGDYEGDYEEDGGDYEGGEENETESRGEKIPAKYNQQTELIVDVESGDNVLDFDLKSE